jgi:eukaryotic-like serine/threonine-protein kinase
MIGTTVGNYRITRLLGEGGMGVVYEAEHPALGRRAAVKILHPELAQQGEMVNRFFNEARAANAIRHPGIVEVFDFGTLPGGASYIVMEFLDGESLAARMRRTGPMQPAAARRLAAQAAGALAAAHGAEIVHRDLKPDNLFLVPDYQTPGAEILKVLDFGIAKLGVGSNQLASVKTRTGAVMGTPTYMSPEQCRGTREVDHRTDVYALGVILYELVCGRPPFETEGFGEMVHLHISAPPPPPRAHNPAVGSELEALILTALEKNPSDRFQSMAEMQAALLQTGGRATAERAPPLAPGPPVPEAATRTRRFDDPPSLRRQPQTTFSGAASVFGSSPPTVMRRRSALGPIIGVGLVAAVGVAGFMVWRQRTAQVAAADDPSSPSAPAAGVGVGAALPPGTAEPPEPPPKPAEPATVSARIASQPAGAKVIRERDGAVLGITPLRETWPKEDGTEKLRVEIEGYQAESIAVPLDRTVNLSLALRKIPAPAAPAPAAGPRSHVRSGSRAGGKPAGGGQAPATAPPRPAAPAAEPEPLPI